MRHDVVGCDIGRTILAAMDPSCGDARQTGISLFIVLDPYSMHIDAEIAQYIPPGTHTVILRRRQRYHVPAPLRIWCCTESKYVSQIPNFVGRGSILPARTNN